MVKSTIEICNSIFVVSWKMSEAFGNRTFVLQSLDLQWRSQRGRGQWGQLPPPSREPWATLHIAIAQFTVHGTPTRNCNCNWTTPTHSKRAVVDLHQFLSRVIDNLSVCPLRSGTRWKRLNISSVFFHHTVARSFYFYQHQTFSQNSDRVTPCGGAKYRWGIKISRFSTNKSLYLANDTRYRHSYNGRRIGTCMRSIKWCHFQWPWTNPNTVFKVTPLCR